VIPRSCRGSSTEEPFEEWGRLQAHQGTGQFAGSRDCPLRSRTERGLTRNITQPIQLLALSAPASIILGLRRQYREPQSKWRLVPPQSSNLSMRMLNSLHPCSSEKNLPAVADESSCRREHRTNELEESTLIRLPKPLTLNEARGGASPFRSSASSAFS